MATTGNKISVIGMSAGWSAALNAFMVKSGKVDKIINVCGRLRVGPTTGWQSFDKMSKSRIAFAESD